jgi:hypothetical protein
MTWNGVDDSRRRGSREATGGLRSASGVPAIPNDIWSRDLAIFPRIQAHSFRRDEASVLQLLRWGRSWSQSVDQP